MRRGPRFIFTLTIACLLAGCSHRPQPPPFAPATTGRPSQAPPPTAGVPRGGIEVRLCRVCVQRAAQVGVGLRDVVRITISRVRGLLSLPPTVVAVRADAAATIPELGVGGFTDTVTGHVTISIDPDTHDLARSLRTWLPLTLAHELDHVERILDGPGYGQTLLATMVSEGLADAFAGQAFPAAPAIPWDHALSGDQERAVWAFARSRLAHRQNSGRHSLWFYGTGRIPRWAGYTIGFDIVHSYLRSHPGATAASIVRLPARRILRESTFRP